MPRFEFPPTVRVARRTAVRAAAATAAAVGLASVMFAVKAAPTFDPDAAPTGWVNRPALTSHDMRPGTEVIYRADYKSGLWTGTVQANYINAAGDVQGNSPWAADTATLLASNHWDTGRRIVTRHTNGLGVPFRWASLGATQQTALGGSTRGPHVLNYVRGDRSNEAPNGLDFRPRDKVQGDIQHSTLLYWRHNSGARRIYVGGNDGMLHAFDAVNGQEVFAYVPSMLMSRLPNLTNDPYAHFPFVDGGLAIADVRLNSGSTRTLLAGALGGGGRGLFMLDVTDPSPTTETAAAGLLKWEITNASSGFANLGYTYAIPRLARMNNGTPAVVVGNGYLNTGNGRATLFVINADTGALIREIDTGSGAGGSPNGLSTPTLFDTDQDGRADFAYAGDLDGNLWRFDLQSTDPGNWSVSKLHTTSPAQAITVAPVVTSHPLGGRLVLFATGRILTAADLSDTAAYHVYGLWDGAPVANTTLLAQTVSEVTASGQRLRQLSANKPNWASGGHRGWRLTLSAGERVVGEGQFMQDERYYLVTSNPTIPAAGSGQASGANWLMEINHLTGGSPVSPVFDINGDGKIDTGDNVNGGIVVGKYLGEGVSSQPVLTDLNIFSVTLFNRQSDLDYTLPRVSVDGGVSGGHFDVDFYIVAGGKFDDIKHTHEYDDKYNVNGVNFLNASDPGFNLGTKVAATTPFKVLVMNQYLNPASMMQVGSADWVSVKDYAGLATAASAGDVLAALPTYTRGNINAFGWKLPLDGFKNKDWWGDGGAARAGLIPTKTGCVNSVNANGATPTTGPNGERHNGALTIQLIKPDTPPGHLELNYPAGGPKYGWRVKAGSVVTYVIAEYTLFWHHPNGKCYGDPGWVPNPPEDPDGSTDGKPPAGTADPRDGVFGVVPAGVTISSVVTTINGATTTTVVTYSDGKKMTTTVKDNQDGTETVTVVDRDGNRSSITRMTSGSTGRAPEEVLQASRRINWREAVRP